MVFKAIRGFSGEQRTRVLACVTLLILGIPLFTPGHSPLVRGQPAAISDADELFRAGRWAEARSAYDAIAKVFDRNSHRFCEAKRGAVQSSLKLKDWNGALNRAAALIPKPELERKGTLPGWPGNLSDDKEPEAALTHQLEFARELLNLIVTASPGSDPNFASRLSTAQIDLEWALIRHLDPPSGDFRLEGDSGLPTVRWWWKDVPEAQEYFSLEEQHSRWRWRDGIPLGHDGQPIFLEPPRAYEAGLPRSKKLLFALEEIERLDKSSKRNTAAAALLARARLMRRLYGPQTDGAWSHALFYYKYDKRPSFSSFDSPAGVKEMWELADDEARTNVGESSRVILLPDSQSPLALLKRLERDYPQSDSVPTALHERGLYYQTRRQFAQALDAYRREIKQFPNHPLVEKTRTQIARIERADVLLGRTGIYASGPSPKLWFACRNASAIEFTAHRFDWEAWLKESGDRALFGMPTGPCLITLSMKRRRNRRNRSGGAARNSRNCSRSS